MAAAGLISPIAFILQAFSQAGVVGSGYQIAIYEAGTTTPATTYTSSTLGIANANPLVLDSSGRLQSSVWAPAGTTLKMVLLDNLDNVIPDATVDNLPMINDISTSLYPETPAETTAGVTPVNFLYPEGDIRRYGATTALADNSTAINNAQAVSSAGGSATYIAPGNYQIESEVVCPAGASMYGAGHASSITASACNGLSFTASDNGILPQPRFYRDFQTLGILVGGTNSYSAVLVDASMVSHVLFSNLAIQNFEYGWNLNGLYYSTLLGCFAYNVWQGIYFNGQSVNVYVLDASLQQGAITGTGISAGISVQGAPELESLQIQGGSIYGFDRDIFLSLIFECKINAVELSFATQASAYIESIIGGMVLRDCWCEQGASSGTIFGIFMTAITPTTTAKVHIGSNYVICDTPVAGSIGIYLGNSNAGLNVVDNHIIGFDMGIGGGNGTTTTGGALTASTIKWNTINVLANSTGTGVYSNASGALFLNSGSTDCEIGPNYVVAGTGAAASIAASSTVTVPTQATSTNQQFPVGTPVQCSTTISGGPTAGVTYWVLTSSGPSLTLAATKGGTAIAWSGTGSIGTLTQTPLPVQWSSIVGPGTSFYGRGAFLLTISDPALSGPCTWTANGKTVSLQLQAALSGSAGATTMSGTGLPAFLAPPVSTQGFLCAIENDTVAGYGYGTVTTAAALNFFTTPLAGAWTNAGTKALLTVGMNWNYT